MKWVADSVVISQLKKSAKEFFLDEEKWGGPIDPPLIIWSKRKVFTSKIFLNNEKVKTQIETFYDFNNDSYNSNELIYDFTILDIKQAAHKDNLFNYDKGCYTGFYINDHNEKIPIRDRYDFFVRNKVNLVPKNERETIEIKSIKWININKLTVDIRELSYQQAYAYWNWYVNCYNQKKFRKSRFISKFIFPNIEQWEYIKEFGVVPSINNTIDIPTYKIHITKIK